MNNIENMISSVMNDPEQMRKVMDIAGSIMGKGGQDAPGDMGGEEAPPQGAEPAEAKASSGSGGFDFGSILSGLTKMPGGLAGAASSFLKSSVNSSSEDKTQLLEAMKPWLSEKRRSKLDGAMKIARVMKNAGSVFFSGGGTA